MPKPQPQPAATSAATPAATSAATLPARHIRALAKALRAAAARERRLTDVLQAMETPLHGVLGMAAHLATTALDSRQRQLVDIIADAGQHLQTVLRNTLAPAVAAPRPARRRPRPAPGTADNAAPPHGVRLLA